MTLRKASLRRAFTLVEVILSIIIILGILAVVLYFYQQAADVRKKALDETEYVTTARMFLEQLSIELHTAQTVESQFIGLEGSSNWIAFVTTSLPQTTRWIIRTNEPAVTVPNTDLKRVEYTLPYSTNLTELTALVRSERLLGVASLVETNLVTSTNEPASEPPTFVTSESTEPATNVVHVASGPVLTDRIQYLQFRYWNGTDWTDSWNSLSLPRGVEVSLGPAPMTFGETNEYPHQVFRRVIHLPRSSHPGNEVFDSAVEEALF